MGIKFVKVLENSQRKLNIYKMGISFYSMKKKKKAILHIEMADLPMTWGDESKYTLKANEQRPYGVIQSAERRLKIVPPILIQTKVSCETPLASQPRRSNGNHLVLTRFLLP